MTLINVTYAWIYCGVVLLNAGSKGATKVKDAEFFGLILNDGMKISDSLYLNHTTRFCL